MNTSTTNKKRTIPHIPLPQASLHVKILDLVTNRLNPHKEDLFLDNGTCNTCVSSITKSPKTQSVKKLPFGTLPKQNRHSKEKVKTNSQNQTKNTTHNNSIYDNQRLSIPGNQSRCLILEKRRVVMMSIDSTKAADLTIDLRGQVQNGFVSQKMLCKLKLQIITLQERIKQLQKEVQIKNYHIQELNKDIQSIRDLARKGSYSDNHLNNNDAISNTSIEAPSLKDVELICRRSHDKSLILPQVRAEKPLQNKTSDQYEYLLRIIRTQAKQFQKLKDSNPFYRGKQYWKQN